MQLWRRSPATAAVVADLLQLFEHPAHDAGTERASSASNHPLRYSRPMLGAESFGPSQNRTCSRIEPIPESPVISRGVIGTLGESNGKSHWRNSNHASVRPKLVRILHVLFPLMRLSGTTPCGAPVLASQPVCGQRGTLLHLVVFTMRVDHCPAHPSPAADRQSPSRTARQSRADSCLPDNNHGPRRDDMPWADTHIAQWT
jgi:hypothetical protein